MSAAFSLAVNANSAQ